MNSLEELNRLANKLTKPRKVRRKRGPVPKGLVRTDIMLTPELLEWGKNCPERLSALCRRLLTAEKKRQERANVSAAAPAASD